MASVSGIPQSPAGYFCERELDNLDDYVTGLLKAEDLGLDGFTPVFDDDNVGWSEVEFAPELMNSDEMQSSWYAKDAVLLLHPSLLGDITSNVCITYSFPCLCPVIARGYDYSLHGQALALGVIVIDMAILSRSCQDRIDVSSTLAYPYSHANAEGKQL
ncbi:hypothetical protein ZIOFF_007605 [Zingiber officinale]|uniref:Uncharacterized protein n=1 Tax=Zingiber officinale TaxID=94328 RepID=A0A8J5IE19_ZINOF|nr:hypothetical protein ZIOFF_007605 [Zingiber officinale]